MDCIWAKAWRASLESPPGGERRGFAGLVELLTFLEKKTREIMRDASASNRDEETGDIGT
jgi:hypothetical protein